MKKHVSIDEESNQVKEFPHVPPEDKVNFWVSKEDIARFRKEVEAEDLLSSARDMVAQTIMGVNRKTEEDEETKQQVESVMSGGIERVLQFLAQHGVKLIPPPGMSTQETAQSSKAEQQVRNMLRKKLMAEQPAGVSEELLARQIHQIMQLPRNKIMEFLRQPSAPPPPPPPPPPRFNWFKDCTDYWVDIPPQIQQAIQVLGYNEDLWNNSEQPEESNKAFQDLSELQQKAVLFLGSTPEQWDSDEPPPPPPAEEPSQDEIMMQKIQELVKTKLLSEQTFNSDETLQGVIHEIMSLPKEKIKEYLQMPPAPKEEATPQAPPASVEEPLPSEEPQPEASMVEKIRELVKFKLQRELNIFDSSELLEGAIDEITSLPREQIKEYLQKPLFPKKLRPKQFNWVRDSNTYWVDLPSEVREAAEELGYVEESWNQTSSKQDQWSHQLETLVTLWAFNPEALNT
jgi:histidinol phosphatase-like enzyme